MSSSAKKVGSVARYGPRYGVRIRSRILEIEREAAKGVPCPRCGIVAVKRVSTSIYSCSHCGYKYAGRAYVGQFRKTVVSKEMTEEESEEKEDK
ncbi:MAG: 50S ribosomal protein L37ae [Thermoplasmata archaeon]|uniref:Large ribosomal subunit protein eL43 n=1 Tax=Candidatus Sysuiplasma superficiale TaxID=2823368 RepID=A0A8J7YQ11_9ARCH|nr:50S ribosomal protein L37ae [Candidatus Sysuiplasma superficiale]MBX8644795.1 50S ribosomal protein L37ae [Candidatus Sysuiplasma superficiale]MCL4347451.1 50S ribosomal protein L37ae [Candidatus Thermoplasmatota archaeon]